MAATPASFYGLDITFLQKHALELQNALSAITLAQQNGIGDKSIQRAQYNDMLAALQAVNAEITRQTSVAEGETPAPAIRALRFKFNAPSY